MQEDIKSHASVSDADAFRFNLDSLDAFNLNSKYALNDLFAKIRIVLHNLSEDIAIGKRKRYRHRYPPNITPDGEDLADVGRIGGGNTINDGQVTLSSRRYLHLHWLFVAV